MKKQRMWCLKAREFVKVEVEYREYHWVAEAIFFCPLCQVEHNYFHSFAQGMVPTATRAGYEVGNF